MTVAPALTTMLFVPGTAEEKFAKIPELNSRAFILDLEDAVPEGEKATSRSRVARLLSEMGGRHRLHVRVNPVDSDHFFDDIETVVVPGLGGIDLPKATTPADIVLADKLIAHYELRAGLALGSIELMATIETVAGLRNAFEIAAVGGRLRRLCFGAGDFTLDVGIDWAPSGRESSATVLFAKTQLVLASRAAGLEAPHDSAFPRYGDLDELRREALESRALGFVGKHAIHPSQLSTIEAVYRPTEREVARATRMVKAFEDAEARGEGAVGLDGELVDYAILYRAQQILAEAKS